MGGGHCMLMCLTAGTNVILWRLLAAHIAPEQQKGCIPGVSSLIGTSRQVAWVVDDGWEAFAELGWVVRTGGDAFRKTHGGKCLWEVLEVCHPPTRFSDVVPTLTGSTICGRRYCPAAEP